MSLPPEDQLMKIIAEYFTVALLNFLNVDYEIVNKDYATEFYPEKDERQYADFIIQIYDDRVINLEFESGALKLETLGKNMKYKINIRLRSKKEVLQITICTGNPDRSLREFDVNRDEKYQFEIYFTQEDDGDEKLKILQEEINKGKEITKEDEKVIHLLLIPRMKSNKTVEELLLEVVKLTNEVKGLNEESKNKIRMYHQMLLEKFVDEKHPLRKEIEKMLGESELMESLFPKQVYDMKTQIKNLGKENKLMGKEKIQMGNRITSLENNKIEMGNKITQMENEKIQMVRDMKNHGDDLEYISKITKIPLEEIKQL